MLQELAVAAMVVLAALYAGARYLPLAWRRRIVFALSGSAGESTLARWLGTESGCGTGCASCKACGPGAPGAAPADAVTDSGARRVIKLHQRR